MEHLLEKEKILGKNNNYELNITPDLDPSMAHSFKIVGLIFATDTCVI